MSHRVLNLMLAAGCGLILWGSATAVEAGFIVTPLESLQSEAPGLTAQSSSSQPAPKDESPALPQQQLRRQNALAAHGSVGGMSTQSISGHGGPTTVSAVPPAPPVPSAGELSVRFSQQREPYHPRFMKTRIFRPPRLAK